MCVVREVLFSGGSLLPGQPLDEESSVCVVREGSGGAWALGLSNVSTWLEPLA